MQEVFLKNFNKNIYIAVFLIGILLLVSVVYKGDKQVIEKSELTKSYLNTDDLQTFKKFILGQIKSPFINLNYEIKKGDTIGKILKKLNIKNSQIQKVINEYNKYGKPNQLLVGNVIDLVIEENISGDKKSISSFFIPITKSTSLEIKKSESGKLESNVRVVIHIYM